MANRHVGIWLFSFSWDIGLRSVLIWNWNDTILSYRLCNLVQGQGLQKQSTYEIVQYGNCQSQIWSSRLRYGCIPHHVLYDDDQKDEGRNRIEAMNFREGQERMSNGTGTLIDPQTEGFKYG